MTAFTGSMTRMVMTALTLRVTLSRVMMSCEGRNFGRRALRVNDFLQVYLRWRAGDCAIEGETIPCGNDERRVHGSGVEGQVDCGDWRRSGDWAGDLSGLPGGGRAGGGAGAA